MEQYHSQNSRPDITAKHLEQYHSRNSHNSYHSYNTYNVKQSNSKTATTAITAEQQITWNGITAKQLSQIKQSNRTTAKQH